MLQLLNRFTYVNNNPLRYSDPSGHFLCDDIDACEKPSDVGVKTPVEKYADRVEYFFDPYPEFDEIFDERQTPPAESAGYLKTMRL